MTGTEPVVVPMTRRHLREVRRIDRAAYPEPWSEALWKAELQRPDRWYVVAVVDGRVVGHGGALRVLDEGHILTMATDPAHRRLGIARRVLGSLVRSLVDAGCTALTLEVRVSNTPAQALYRQFGFVPVGVRKGYYEPEGEDALIMWVHDADGPDFDARLAGLEAGEAVRCR